MTGPAQSPPVSAQLARWFVLLEAWPGPLALVFLILRITSAWDVDRNAALIVVTALGLSALAVASCVGLGSRPWAWWTAIATNLLHVLLWIGLMVWSWVWSSQIDGVDGGMLFASVFAIGLPMIALAGVGLVLLVLPPVPRYYLRALGRSGAAGLGSRLRGYGGRRL